MLDVFVTVNPPTPAGSRVQDIFVCHVCSTCQKTVVWGKDLKKLVLNVKFSAGILETVTKLAITSIVFLRQPNFKICGDSEKHVQMCIGLCSWVNGCVPASCPKKWRQLQLLCKQMFRALKPQCSTVKGSFLQEHIIQSQFVGLAQSGWLL